MNGKIESLPERHGNNEDLSYLVFLFLSTNIVYFGFFFIFFFYNTGRFLFFNRNLIYFPLWSIQSGSDPDNCIFHSFFPILWPVELAYSSSGFSSWTPVRSVLSELMYTRFSILKNRISVQFSIFPVEPLHRFEFQNLGFCHP